MRKTEPSKFYSTSWKSNIELSKNIPFYKLGSPLISADKLTSSKKRKMRKTVPTSFSTFTIITEFTLELLASNLNTNFNPNQVML